MDQIKGNLILEVLKTALRREVAAFNYYMKSSAKTDDKETAALLIQLAEEERKHRQYLNQEIEKIELLLDEDDTASAVDANEVRYPIPEHPEFKRLHSISWVDLAAVSLPVELLGGDFFDTIVLDRKDEEPVLAIFLYDVMGHGIEATHVKAMGRQIFGQLRDAWLAGNYRIDLTRPEVVMKEMNREIIACCQGTGRFITSFYGIIDPVAKKLVYTSAGHDPPILIRGDGEYIHLEETQLLLGAADDVAYSNAGVSLHPEDILVLYSDGITEATNSRGKMWERDGLIKTVQKISNGPSKEIIASIFRTLKHFLKRQPITDEFTLVVMKIVDKLK